MNSSRLAAALLFSTALGISVRAQPAPSDDVPRLHLAGATYRDLNRNGRLDIYEDPRQSPAARTRDLLGQMSLEELAGLMVHGTLPSADDPIGRGSTYDFAKAANLIQNGHVNTFITRLNPEPAEFARQNNQLQRLAAATRLGIPLTISTDPRSHFLYTAGASVESSRFSQWPETTGLAAIGSPALVRTFADIVRQEYRAVGITEALSPQADLSTEPRWPRLNGTFGEDAEIARALVEAYVAGMQNGGNGLNPGSVATVVKHWAGYGAQQGGLDSHNHYGQIATFPARNFPYHLIPFTGAFAANVAAVMPTYSILQGVSFNGKPSEPVGGGFNRPLLDLLRNQYHFDGVVLSDWLITNDCLDNCLNGAPAGQPAPFTNIGMDWGVESLSKEQRFAKAINAGVDQIGGVDDSQILVDAVHHNLLTRERLQQSAYRILLQKFQMGLFDDPYVDPAAAGIVGSPAFLQQGQQAQKRAVVLLQNKTSLLPLAAGKAPAQKLFLFGIDPAIAARHGFTVVDNLQQADLVVIRAETPFEVLHPGYTFGSRQHEGRLDFRAGDPAYDALTRAAAAHIPAVFTVYLDRPAILTGVLEKAAAVLGNFGINDNALFDVLTGETAPAGHLPFELPRSMAAVRAQKEDLPHDSANPLFPFGFGLLNYGRTGPLRAGR